MHGAHACCACSNFRPVVFLQSSILASKVSSIWNRAAVALVATRGNTALHTGSWDHACITRGDCIGLLRTPIALPAMNLISVARRATWLRGTKSDFSSACIILTTCRVMHLLLIPTTTTLACT